MFFIPLLGVKIQIIDFYVFISILFSIIFVRSFRRVNSLLFSVCLLYFLALILSAFYGFFRTLNIGDAVLSFRFILIFLFVLFFTLEKSDVKFDLDSFFLKVLCFWSLFSIFYGVLQLAEFYSFIPYGDLPHHYLLTQHMEDFKEDWGRASGFFKGPNELGWFGVLATCFILPKVLNGDLKYLLFFISSISLPFISNSRSAIASLVIVFFYLSVSQVFTVMKLRVSHSKLRSILIFVMLTITIIFLSFLFSDYLKFERVFSAVEAILFSTNDSSLSERYRLWSVAYSVWVQYPLFGVGGDPSHYAPVVDSGWLSYLLRGGVVLFLIYTTFLLMLLYYSLKFYLHSNKDKYISIFLFTLCIIFANFFVSIQHFIFIFIFIAYAIRNLVYERN
ncbi:O-antigen ligase family protein [Shewanella gaetbuli]|uniref:O-antigen ligase family protein n=1 Tax=Shewanella gaetbuli TaxID=220752 RepID=A0A9X1ZKL3_9GAMM|nr:O-antigen ligase family protein [Shewanella gaetbuli]MCL1141562.1 O-antigen ligase family protein [Shewanella gaetbuli]